MVTRRRVMIALAASALVPPAAFAQQPPKVWRVGFLNFPPLQAQREAYDRFVDGLRELGYVEGKNLVMEMRAADGINERLSGLAEELVRLKVDVILCNSGTAFAAQKATSTIPIVFANTFDPVGLGLVASLARPGGNITGISNALEATSGKNLEYLRAVVPKLARVAVLTGAPATRASNVFMESMQPAAKAAGINISLFRATTPAEIVLAFGAMARARSGALIVVPGPFLTVQARQITELAAKNRLPAMYTLGIFVDAGGLLSYGPTRAEMYHQAARQVDKILKGAKPADIPVEQPTEFELVINMKTARALGIKFPKSILVQAVRVIE